MAWAKGESGNPNGRPQKGETLTDILRAYGDGQDKDAGVDRKVKLASVLWDLALSGDVASIKYIYDRVDGRPKESHNLTGDIDAPLRIIYEAVSSGD